MTDQSKVRLVSAVRDAVRVFRRSGLATAGLVALAGIVAIAALAPAVAPYDPVAQSRERLAAPTSRHLLGTDEFGRDSFSRILHGSRVSLLIGLTSVLVAAVAGTSVGMIAGYLGGWVDDSLSRVADGILAFPSVLIGVIVLVIFGPGAGNVALAIAIAFFPRFLRLSRAETLALREIEYIEAGRALGLGTVTLLFRHVLPNILGTTVTMATLWAAAAIRLEAGLSFLGLGVQPPAPSWGLMLKDGMSVILFSPWLSLFPGIAIFLTVLSLNMVGDGIRDVLDPRGRTGNL